MLYLQIQMMPSPLKKRKRSFFRKFFILFTLLYFINKLMLGKRVKARKARNADENLPDSRKVE